MLTSKKVSESVRLGSILMFSGGFLDAYSYLVRGEVFATAETGNIALMGISLARGDLDWREVMNPNRVPFAL